MREAAFVASRSAALRARGSVPTDRSPRAWPSKVHGPLAPTSPSSAPARPLADPVIFGPLGRFVDDPAATDVLVRGHPASRCDVWVDRGRGLDRVEAPALDESAVRELAVRLVGAGGRHIDEATPCVDVRIGDGIRVHAVLPPVSTTGTLISIRLPRREPLTLDELAAGGFLAPDQLVAVRVLVAERRNVLVTGAAGSGKTTLLAAMLADAPASERIVTVEDVAELRVPHPHVVGLEARQANIEGAGGIGLERLVREALRMRPDRIVVGECRGPELRELLNALNTGHDGGAGTLHANSLRDVPARLEALGAIAGLMPDAVARLAASAVHAVLHVERTDARRLSAIGTLRIDDGRLSIGAESG